MWLTADRASAVQPLLLPLQDPVSPHLAAVREGRVIPDGAIVSAVAAQLQHFSTHLLAELGAGCSGSGTSSSSGGGWQQPQWASRGLSVVETAGGVTSPGPSGTLQVSGPTLSPLAWRRPCYCTPVRLLHCLGVDASAFVPTLLLAPTTQHARVTCCARSPCQPCWWVTPSSAASPPRCLPTSHCCFAARAWLRW